MPTYTFKCPFKGCREFDVPKEVFQSIKTNRPLCGACGGSTEIVINNAPNVKYIGGLV